MINEMVMKYGNEITLKIKESFEIYKHKFIAGDKLIILDILEQNKILIELFDKDGFSNNKITLSSDDLEQMPFKLVDIIRKPESSEITFEQFNSRLFDTSAIKWFNNKGILKINDNINAIILPIQYQDHINNLYIYIKEAYIGYKVTIINKKIGELDNQSFIFDDHLTVAINELNFPRENRFMFGDYNEGGFHWYLLDIDRKEFSYYEKEMMEYIDTWK
jgi:hypothetical protein